MTTLPADFKPIDPGRVDASDPVEMAYWCVEFGCSHDELTDVIGRVGTHVTAVREALASLPRGAR